MTEDFFLLDIPVFVPEYDKEKKYGWTKYKDELWDLLIRTTNGYCMYCYDNIIINGQKIGQIEHGIEKMNSMERLIDCVPNLGISCSICNEKYKRRGERRRRLSEESIKQFEEGECLKYDCKGACGRFDRIREEYVKKGAILLQPFGYENPETKNVLKIQYDLLNCKYVPYLGGDQYTEQENIIIKKHIEQFGLN